ncbi:F-box protein At1g80960-like [Trifolium pratense]|uniref:F-box protein At1g80960-like n=1 Tax=Trifolium pratense TaxID=57577 RepID=UPI001E6962EF|nr:F-box protein At1g80960-like [Trifolium pratense]
MPRRTTKEKDMISDLPDEILVHCILCSLSIDEIFRTSILSKRWKHLWKNSSHLDFNWTRMNKSLLTRKLIATRNDAIKYGDIVKNMLHQHSGKLSVLSAFESCEKLKSLKLKSMFMENNIIDRILKKCLCLEKFSLIDSKGFDRLKIENQSLKTLEFLRLNVREIEVHVKELQDLVIDSLICLPKGLRIYSEKLLSFYSTYNPNAHWIWKSTDFLENCSDLLESQPTNIFRNLLTLSIDLDLNNIREAIPLSYVLLTCVHLNTLSINIPVKKATVSSEDYDYILSYPKSMFWEKREPYYFVLFNELKYFTIKGFTGKEQEVKFAELLITKSLLLTTAVFGF